jgi:hypothetical protein
LQVVDEKIQADMLRLLDDFAENAQEMDKFSKKLAIIILTHGVDKNKLS